MSSRICIKCKRPGTFGTQVIADRIYTRTTCKKCRLQYQRDLRAKNIIKHRIRDAGKMRSFRKGDYYKQHPEKMVFSKPWSRLNIEKYLFITIRRRKAKAGEKYKLKMTFKEFLDEIGGVAPPICPVLGIQLFISDESHSGNLPSIDRIDSSKPYQQGNIAVMSRRANILKGDGTADEHRKIAEWMDRQKGDPSV